MEKLYLNKNVNEKSLEKNKAKTQLVQSENLLAKLDSLYSSFDYIKLSIASPSRIASWSMREIEINIGNNIKPKIIKRSVGEVTNNETVKFTDFSPIAGGLFCEKIFGPLKTGFCSCNYKYESFGYGYACPRCYVEFTDSRVRRYRLGIFKLFVPVAHTWFLRGRPSYLEQVLGISKKSLETALYYKELFQPFDYSKLPAKEKHLLYPIFFFSQTTKNYPNLCAEFCFFLSTVAKYRREHLQNFENFLKLAATKLKFLQKKFSILVYQFYEKSNNHQIKFLKRRLPSLQKKLIKLVVEITNINKFIKNYKKNRPDYYISYNFDSKLMQDFEHYYTFLAKNQIGFLSQFTQKAFYKIFTKQLKLKEKQSLLQKNSILKENYYETLGKNLLSEYYSQKYSGKTRKRYNGEIIHSMLEDIDLKEEIFLLREKLSISFNKNDTINKIVKRLRILESFYNTNTTPTSMLLSYLPILSPTLRPLQELENGKLISADLNEVYRLIILRTRRVFAYNLLGSQNNDFSIFRSQILKSVQEAVDCLIDNARLPAKQQILLNNRPLKTLTELLEGKEGRFRQTLLGKRVDYSGRSVIVVNPELKLNQCGLPFQMAKILFEPFLIALLLELKLKLEFQKISENDNEINTEIYHSLSYKKFLRMLLNKNKPLIWSLLFHLSKEYSILLNRAPTLHKFGIQAFDPLIILGKAIQLHPLACTGFNADFDGDQMAVHLPMYAASQIEIKSFLKSSANIFSVSNGEVILKPSQDIVIGTYYLTYLREKYKTDHPQIFTNKNQVLIALLNKKIELQTPIFIRCMLPKFSFYINQNNLNFSENFFKLWQEPVKIYKFFSSFTKGYLLTNKGIFIAYPLTQSNYILNSCYFETTAGRLLLHTNFLNYPKYNQ